MIKLLMIITKVRIVVTYEEEKRRSPEMNVLSFHGGRVRTWVFAPRLCFFKCVFMFYTFFCMDDIFHNKR